MEFQNGKRVWGQLMVFYNGLELVYPAPHPDAEGDHFETSFIVYQEQYPAIYALMRLHDELLPENQHKREEEIRQTYHPRWLRRIWRHVRNAFNIMRDAFVQTVSLLIGAAKKGSSSTFLATQDKRIEGTARELLGQAAAYEPMLERYIGRKVVLDIHRDNTNIEYCGILKDYTSAFIELLDVAINEKTPFNLAVPEQLAVNKEFDFELTCTPVNPGDTTVPQADVHLVFHNRSTNDVRLSHVENNAYSRNIDKEVVAGTSCELDLDHIPLPVLNTVAGGMATKNQAGSQSEPGNIVLPDLQLWIQAERFMDLVVPRPQGVIRHGAEHVEPFGRHVFGDAP
jgi:hypothetical protein